MGKLTALQVKNATKRGYLGDGDGLYLRITPTATKSWVFRYRNDGKLREHGLGSVNTLTLAEAREEALSCRKLRLQGLDPIVEKSRQRIASQLEAAKSVSFKDCVESYVDAHKSSWRNAKHTWQWSATLVKYAYPVFGDLPVGQIDMAMVLKVLKPIWYDKTETASRVRGRIETVLDFARVQGFREGENPARWRGNLSLTLPAKNKIMKVEHMKALPHAEIADFWGKLSKHEGAGADALRLAILTAARSGEVRGATVDEFDLEQALWTIPAERMKANTEHRVPLSSPAVELVKTLIKQCTDGLLFQGMRKGKPISDGTLLAVLKRMGYKDRTTVHGFRSTFRVWAAEETDAPREIAEMALAHTVGNKVEAAYYRTDLFDKRKALMINWASYCIEGKNVA